MVVTGPPRPHVIAQLRAGTHRPPGIAGGQMVFLPAAFAALVAAIVSLPVGAADSKLFDRGKYLATSVTGLAATRACNR